MSLKPKLKMPVKLIPAKLKLPLSVSPMRAVYNVTTLLVFAAVTHICIILFMPYLSYGNAWNRLEQFVPVNQLAALTGTDSGPPPLPFMAPDVRYAACRYDLANGPLELHTPIQSELWSIALYNKYGENYYLLSGQDVQGRAVNMLLVMEHTLDPDEKEDVEDQNTATREVHEVTVSAPSSTGIILIRAPVPSEAYRNEIEAGLRDAYCKPIDFTKLEKARKPLEPVAEPEPEQKPVKSKRSRRRNRSN